MKHYNLEQWIRYARQAPPLTEEEIFEYEEHLHMCDECLELYMQGLELAAEAYPDLSDPEALVENVMQSLPPVEPLGTIIHSSTLPVKKSGQQKNAWLRHPIFHYTVAAAITLVLMSSGAFTTIMDRLQQGQLSGAAIQTEMNEQGETGYTPVSQLILNKTIGMLDSIQAKNERGGTR